VGSSEEREECRYVECPVDCSWQDWGPWDKCICGEGTKTRVRAMAWEHAGGARCPDKDTGGWERASCDPSEGCVSPVKAVDFGNGTAPVQARTSRSSGAAQGSELVLELNRSLPAGKPLGIEFEWTDDSATLRISRIADVGLFADYNSKNVQNPVSVGDEITAVNNVTDRRDIQTELKKNGVLRIKIYKPGQRARDTWVVSVTKSQGQSLGIEFSFAKNGSGLRVTKISPSGLIADWNKQNTGHNLSVGDVIMEVNGVKSTSDVEEELKTFKRLDVVVARPPPDAAAAGVSRGWSLWPKATNATNATSEATNATSKASDASTPGNATSDGNTTSEADATVDSASSGGWLWPRAKNSTGKAGDDAAAPLASGTSGSSPMGRRKLAPEGDKAAVGSSRGASTNDKATNATNATSEATNATSKAAVGSSGGASTSDKASDSDASNSPSNGTSGFSGQVEGSIRLTVAKAQGSAFKDDVSAAGAMREAVSVLAGVPPALVEVNLTVDYHSGVVTASFTVEMAQVSGVSFPDETSFAQALARKDVSTVQEEVNLALTKMGLDYAATVQGIDAQAKKVAGSSSFRAVGGQLVALVVAVSLWLQAALPA
jgi:hypothetical protein